MFSNMLFFFPKETYMQSLFYVSELLFFWMFDLILMNYTES